MFVFNNQSVWDTTCVTAIWLFWLVSLVRATRRRRRLDVAPDAVALVTGAGSGIGRLVAHRLAKQIPGGKVVCVDLNMKGLQGTVASAPAAMRGRLVPFQCDVTDPRQLQDLFEHHPTVDVLVNNAGIVWRDNGAHIDADKLEKTLAVNAVAPARLWNMYTPRMIAGNRQTYVVTVASASAFCAAPDMVAYSASKAAVYSLADGLHASLVRDGHADRVNTLVVCPSFVDTGMFQGFRQKWWVNLLSPPLQPEEVADQIVQSMVTKANRLIMPAFVYNLIWMRVLPIWMQDRIAALTGVHSVMSDFKSKREGGIAKR